jgi:hypothetical protein
VRGSGTLPALEDFITSGQRYTRQFRQPLHTLVQNFWNVPEVVPGLVELEVAVRRSRPAGWSISYTVVPAGQDSQ